LVKNKFPDVLEYLESLPYEALGSVHGNAFRMFLKLIQYGQLTELKNQMEFPFPPVSTI
jgi:hypothetical protein